MRLTGDIEGPAHIPRGLCVCACHRSAHVFHPVPCCAPCARCGLAIPTGLTHQCSGPFHRTTVVAHGRGLLRALTRIDLMFSAFIVVVVMALAVFSLPAQGSLVLLAAGLGGMALGVGLIVWRKMRHRGAGSDRTDA